MTPERSAEAALLHNMQTRRTELAHLLEECSSHWGYEDPVYRFYHQSYKVFELQYTTENIVRLLHDLAPGRSLQSWFVDIVTDGTGHRFTLKDNENWTLVTRPIVEAFFHARFFLEMAVRYSTLEEPPTPLPSGYAALLYLYELR